MNDRQAGAALVGVLLLLVVLSGLTGVVVRLAVVERRLARSWTRYAQATEVARAGTLRVVEQWHAGFSLLATGDSAAFGGADPLGTAWYSGWVHHLEGPFFLVRTNARTPDGAARAAAGLVVRVVAPPMGTVASDGCWPPWMPIAPLDVREQLARLAPWADRTLPPGAHAWAMSQAILRRTAVTVVHGDLELSDGEGEGVLLVAGDLTVAGDFRYRGLVVIGGAVRPRGGRLDVVGALRSGESSDLGSSARVRDDMCVLEEVALRLARPRPLTAGGWLAVLD